MKIRKYITPLLFLLLCACQPEESMTELQGSLVVQLIDSNNSAAETRKTPNELDKPLAQSFKLRIINQVTANTIYDGLLGNFKMPAYLKPATYTLEASYGNNALLELDAPFYQGDVADVKVAVGRETAADIPCILANALASVTYTNQTLFDKLFSSYVIEAKIGAETIVWDPMDGTHLYFKAKERLILSLKGIKRVNGAPFVLPLDVIESTIPQMNYGYQLTLESSASNEAIFDIIIDTSVEEVSITETLPETWLPKPKVVAEGFENTICTVVETVESTTAKLLMQALKPIQDITFTFAFESQNLQTLNKTYQLTTLSEEDRTILTQAGIVLPELATLETALDLTTITTGLVTIEGGTTVNNHLTIAVKANNRWSDIYDFTLQVVKPIFKPSCYPGNIWTKQFQANTLLPEDVTQGNFEKLNPNLSYEWSIDQSTWNPFVAPLEIKNLTPDTPYYIRAWYRDIMSQILTVRTYPEIMLANGGLETYSVVAGKDGDKWGGRGAQFEWTSWATINERTTVNCPITAYSYNTRSGSRPVDRASSIDNSGKKAVWISTIGYGYGGTNSAPKYVTPSELFLGVYDTKGINYVSRPTSVRFWYKYAPYQGDKSDIQITILHGTTVLGSGVLQQSELVADYTEHQISLTYDEQYQHLAPEKISLVFKSGFNTACESRESGGLINSNTANPKFRGSELFIDDVSLVYDK